MTASYWLAWAALSAINAAVLLYSRHNLRESVLLLKAAEERVGCDVCTDMRKPGESFCADCPDHEGCMQGIPCGLVKTVHERSSR